MKPLSWRWKCGTGKNRTGRCRTKNGGPCVHARFCSTCALCTADAVCLSG